MSAGAILDTYIAGQLCAAEAALQLTASFLLAAGEGADGVESWLWSTWALVLKAVRSVDYNDPALQALAALLGAIREVPMSRTPALDAFDRLWGRSESEFWQTLPIFGPAVREEWSGIGSSRDFYTRAQWATMNAFLACLSTAHVLDFSLYGIWTMRDTFEEVSGTVRLDNYVPAAAVWVLEAGNLMYDLAQKAQPPEWIANKSNGGPLWKGRIWYSLERWAFWKQGFYAAIGTFELDNWAKEMATRAHHKMEQIEQQGSH